ncbi:MAG: hypothetical protein J6Y86_07465 [Pseudobutyrivibrio sp.]|nr:hypothetical protein [Pseudobutyrivibrio sp.]
MAAVKFLNVVAKDGQTAAQRFAAMTKEQGVFYKVADTGEEVHYYLEAQLISADKASEIAVLDAAGVFDGANVETVLNELHHQAANEKIWFVDATPASGSAYAAVYEIYQGENAPDAVTDPATLIGTINIPKDAFVDDGSVVDVVFVAADNSLHEGDVTGPDITAYIVPSGSTATEADAGKYIKLVLQNVNDPLYIAAKDLVDIYTGGTTAEATVSVANNEITVTIEKISGTKIIYRAESYVQVQAGDEFDATATYYTYDAVTDTYTADATVDATNFDAKVAAGLYTKVNELNINAKVDQVEADLNALKAYVGEIPASSEATTVIGYVDEKTQGGVSSLNGEAGVATKSAGDVVTIKGGVIEVEGIIQNAPNADKASTEDVYYDAVNNKIYSDSAMTIEVTPVTTKTYIDQVSGKHFDWTGKKFVEVVPDVTLAKVAVTGAAEDVSIADAGSLLEATNVEEAIQELATQLTWQDV